MASSDASYPNRGNEIMAYMREFHAKYEWMPTRREIADGCEISSTSTVDYWLKRLHQARRIYCEPGQPRCIRILEAPF